MMPNDPLHSSTWPTHTPTLLTDDLLWWSHASLDRLHLLHETTCGSIQPFCHSTFSGQTRRHTDRQGYRWGTPQVRLIDWLIQCLLSSPQLPSIHLFNLCRCGAVRYFDTRCGNYFLTRCGVSWRGARGARGVCGAVFRGTPISVLRRFCLSHGLHWK